MITDRRLAGAFPAALSGEVPEGWPQEQRGAPYPGPERCLGSHRFVLGSVVGGQYWAEGEPGQLGYSAPEFLGLWDRRNTEGRPDEVNQDWYREASPQQGRGMSLRVQLLDGPPVLSSFGAARAIGPLRQAALSLVIAGFDAPYADLAKPPAEPAFPGFSLPGSTWTPARRARFAVNIMPDLCQQGVAEVDLDQWADQSRFVAAWLWSYWVGVRQPDTEIAAEWSVWDRPPLRTTRSIYTISQPILSCPPGPMPSVPTDTYEAWCSSPPHLSGGSASVRRAISNGGAPTAVAVIETSDGPISGRNYIGPSLTLVAAGQQTVVEVVPSPAGRLLWYLASSDPGASGGPVILSSTWIG